MLMLQTLSDALDKSQKNLRNVTEEIEGIRIEPLKLMYKTFARVTHRCWYGGTGYVRYACNEPGFVGNVYTRTKPPMGPFDLPIGSKYGLHGYAKLDFPLHFPLSTDTKCPFWRSASDNGVKNIRRLSTKSHASSSELHLLLLIGMLARMKY